MEAKRFYIRTFGCQMNEYDSRLLTDLLISSGWTPTSRAEEAVLVVFNTCSVRHKAETRVYGHLSGVASLKRLNPEVRVAVVGCMAQRLGEGLLDRFPLIDLVLGTEEIFSLPEILESEDLRERVKLKLSGRDFGELATKLAPFSAEALASFVAITRGCDNFCSYCIVPYLRGPLRCRPHPQILKEVEALVTRGAKQITLIGQNVDSYFDGEIDFPDLLERVCSLPGLQRVRFTTSHPKDFGEKLLEKMANLPQLCEHLHLPLQSGSNQILGRMNRNYTVEEYVQKVEGARERIPGLCITTDLIVGFPGERETDFERTLEAVRKVGFDASFTFRYSPREGTAAASFDDDVPEAVKIGRLNRLIAFQRGISEKRNRELAGTVQEILVEGHSRRQQDRWKGKSRGGKTVLFSADRESLLGKLCRVRITSCTSKTLFGEGVS
ncbi:MAG: hypothetical protein AMJ41_02220 [candidate division Zixibacteria bacterium DG_27]|nr:MAG: hypothetical protein AMJ41_02220 [candidate division Zixibacteria bacterium DG_27]